MQNSKLDVEYNINMSFCTSIDKIILYRNGPFASHRVHMQIARQ